MGLIALDERQLREPKVSVGPISHLKNDYKVEHFLWGWDIHVDIHSSLF